MEIYTKSSDKQKKSRQLEVGQRVFVLYVAKPIEQEKNSQKMGRAICCFGDDFSMEI